MMKDSENTQYCQNSDQNKLLTFMDKLGVMQMTQTLWYENIYTFDDNLTNCIVYSYKSYYTVTN